MAATAEGPSFQGTSPAGAAKPRQSPEGTSARQDKPSEVKLLNSKELTRALSRLLNPEQPPSRVPERFAITPLIPDSEPEQKAVPSPSPGKSKAGASSPGPESGQAQTGKRPPEAAVKAPLTQKSQQPQTPLPQRQAPVSGPSVAQPAAVPPPLAPVAPVVPAPKAAGEWAATPDAGKTPALRPSSAQSAAPDLQSQAEKNRASAQAKEKEAAPATGASRGPSAAVPSENEKAADARIRGDADSEEVLARRNIVRAEIRPRNLVILSAPYDGVISAVLAHDGDNVKKDQAVARVDTRVEEHALAAAQALSSEVFERLGTLPEGPSRERDALAAEYLRHSAAIKAHEARLSQAEIAAPFTGTITEVRAKAGEHVKQGSPILEIAERGALEIVCSVPSTWVRWLKPGHIVWVYVDETAKSYEAVLTRLGGKVDAASKTLKVYARFSRTPTDLLPGMSGSASIRQQLADERQGGK